MFMVFPLGQFFWAVYCRSGSIRRSGDAAGTIGTLAHLGSQPLFTVSGQTGLLDWPFRYSEMKKFEFARANGRAKGFVHGHH
jgi:hypothetical protein